MRKILAALLAVAIALAPALALAQGRITGQQSYVTGSKPEPELGKHKAVKTKKAKAVHHKRSHKVAKAPPGNYRVVKIRKAKAAHHKHSSRKVAKAAHYAKHANYRPGHHQHHGHGHNHWLLPAIVGTAIGLGLFHFWH